MSQQASKQIAVMGRRWDGGAPVHRLVLEGQSLERIVLDTIQAMRRERQYSRAQARSLLRYARCRVNGFEIPRAQWADTCPKPGDRIEVLRGVLGGGGGGGKNAMGIILGVVISVAAVWAGPFVAGALGLTKVVAGATVLTTAGMFVAGGVSAGIMLAGGMLVNALFPTAQPALSGPSFNDRAKDSPTYSINGARNTANPYGFVPLVLGRHRHTPPLAAKSWTVWEGDKQFFNMCVCWGHPDIEVTDFRIGKTILSNYKQVEHVFHQSTTGNDLKLFAKSYNEQSVSAVLKESEGWTTRTIGEAEDISVDIAFQRGLTVINQENGNNEWRTVTFQAQYKKKEDEEWKNVVAGSRVEIHGKTQTVEGGFFRKPNVYSDWNGNISIGYGIGGDIQIYPNRNPYVSGCNVNISYPGENKARVEVSDGVFDNQGIIEISGAQTKALVKNFRAEGLERATYEVRIKRLTGDTSSQYIMDEATWSTVRAILNEPAFNTPVPVCVSELRIQASEQLSGYVDDFNAICHSKVPDWDGEQWTVRTTSNPASLIRYLLTSRHGLNTPYTTAKIDDTALVAFHEWCVEQGHEFNFVCDTEEVVWSRLVQVASPGRGGITTDRDGMYSVVIDRSGKTPVQLFTPRNSWGLRVERGFADLPHALRVKFIDEKSDYVQTESFVYADGYDRSNAVNIVEWDYPGVTNWESLWKMGRYHLAKLLHRQMTISLSTDWEWLACRRGDMVGVASDVLMNVFGTARVQRLAYVVDGQGVLAGRPEEVPLDPDGNPLLPVGVQLDDSVVFSDPAPARYGIAIRDTASRMTSYEIVPEYGEERSVLYFKNPITAAQVPPFQALASVSILGDEYAEYLVASITPGDNASADLSLIPYAAKEIEAASEGDILPYEPPLHLDVIGGTGLPTPLIVDIRSDESVLIRSASGGTIPRIAAWWKMDAGQNESGLVYQIMATPVGIGSQASGMSTGLEEFVAAQGVIEGEVYDVRIRAISQIGRTSAWSTPVRHKVIGRTTPPPAPDGVFLSGYSISIRQSNRPLDVVGHKVFMAMDENDDISMALELTNPYTTTGTFDLQPWAGRARAIFVRTVDELGLLSDPVRIVVNLGDVLPDNVLFEFSEREREWSGEITGGYVSGDTLFADENAYLWPQGDDAPLWQQDNALPLWPSGTAETLVYMWQVDIPAGYAGARVLVLPDAVSGRLQRLEFRHYKEPYLWPQDDAAYLWPQPEVSVGADGQEETVDPYLWPQPEVSEWDVMPDNYLTPGGETLEFRVTYANTEQAQLLDIVTVLDVTDKDHHLEDIVVAASGDTRIPLPPGYFRGITNIQITLQYDGNGSVQDVRFVRGSEIMGSDGYLTDGPFIRAITSQGTLTTANCDITLIGY